MAHDLLRTLIALTVASSGAALVVLLLRLPVRGVFGAGASYFAWLLVPVAMVASCLPDWAGAATVLPASLQITSLSAVRAALDASLRVGSQAPVSVSTTLDWVAVALGVWLAGASLFLAYLVGLQRAFLKNLGALSGPALVGVLHPQLVLPADFEQRYTVQEQLLVLAHERVHLKRADAMWNALVALMRCVFWFNPVVHLAAQRLRVDQELACDAAVMQRHPDARRAYANAMLKAQLAADALPAGCHWRSEHPLKERLMTLKQPPPGRARRALGRAFIATTSLIVAYGAWALEPTDVPAPRAPSAPLVAAAPGAPPVLPIVAEPSVPPAPPVAAAPSAPPALPVAAAPRMPTAPEAPELPEVPAAVPAVPAEPAVLPDAPPTPPQEPVVPQDAISTAPAAPAAPAHEPQPPPSPNASSGTSRTIVQTAPLSMALPALTPAADSANRASTGVWELDGNVRMRAGTAEITADSVVMRPDGTLIALRNNTSTTLAP